MHTHIFILSFETKARMGGTRYDERKLLKLGVMLKGDHSHSLTEKDDNLVDLYYQITSRRLDPHDFMRACFNLDLQKLSSTSSLYFLEMARIAGYIVYFILSSSLNPLVDGIPADAATANSFRTEWLQFFAWVLRKIHREQKQYQLLLQRDPSEIPELKFFKLMYGNFVDNKFTLMDGEPSMIDSLVVDLYVRYSILDSTIPALPARELSEETERYLLDPLRELYDLLKSHIFKQRNKRALPSHVPSLELKSISNWRYRGDIAATAMRHLGRFDGPSIEMISYVGSDPPIVAMTVQQQWVNANRFMLHVFMDLRLATSTLFTSFRQEFPAVLHQATRGSFSLSTSSEILKYSAYGRAQALVQSMLMLLTTYDVFSVTSPQFVNWWTRTSWQYHPGDPPEKTVSLELDDLSSYMKTARAALDTLPESNAAKTMLNRIAELIVNMNRTVMGRISTEELHARSKSHILEEASGPLYHRNAAIWKFAVMQMPETAEYMELVDAFENAMSNPMSDKEIISNKPPSLKSQLIVWLAVMIVAARKNDMENTRRSYNILCSIFPHFQDVFAALLDSTVPFQARIQTAHRRYLDTLKLYKDAIGGDLIGSILFHSRKHEEENMRTTITKARPMKMK